MITKNTFKLAAYSSLAANFLLGTNHAEAQAVYTELDPYIHISGHYPETYSIDMDNNGIDDFTLLQFQWHFTTSFLYRRFFNYGVDVGPNYTGNVEAIAGKHFIYHTSPYALNYGDEIGNDLPFQNYAPQIMAGRTQPIGYPLETDEHQIGYWYINIKDHYLGVRFQDEDDCTHYGWIRCDVLDTVRKLVIKDFAYETKCDVPIKAGDMVGDTTVSINTIHLSSAAIYSFNNAVFINLPLLNNTSVIIHIYNITGEEIYASTTKNNKTTIPLQVTAGIYLVEVISGENRVSKKVMIK